MRLSVKFLKAETLQENPKMTKSRDESVKQWMEETVSLHTSNIKTK